jgi:hypothetical protein
MRKLLLIITIYFLSLLNISYAANSGPASVLKITMKKMELCTGYTGGDFNDILTDDFCHNPVVIGSGDKVVDITSVLEDQIAALYGNPASLPLGETYTHMRTTIGKKFTIKSGSINAGGSTGRVDDCKTVAVDDASYVTSEAANKYTHRTAVAEGGNSKGDAEEMNVYFVNGAKKSTHNSIDPTYSQCINADCTSVQSSWWQQWNDTPALLSSDDQIAWSIPQSGVSTDDMVLVYALSKPYTVSLIPPTIDIAFGTSNSIGVQEVCANGSNCTGQTDGMCSFYINEVKVTIDIK